jgi:two-component system cell cycle response regulator
VAWFSPDLQPLLAVAVATLDEQGTLLEANAGFLRLIKAHGPPAIGALTARFFLQPDFAALLQAPEDADGLIHRGLLTLGDPLRDQRSLDSRVWRVNGQVRLLAEYDVDDLERLYDIVIELNRDYAKAQFELAQTNLKLQQREAEIRAVSLTDPLTGVGNRRRLEQALECEVSRTARTGEPCSAFMADLDHFKHINDTNGHEAGDGVLVAFGDLLRRETRPTDVVARFGGEEFVVLMPHTTLGQALATAERIRAALAKGAVGSQDIFVTGSFGVARLAPDETVDAFLRRLDQALYGAKHSGRNCVVAR